MVSFLLFCAIFLMIGCSNAPPTINNLNIDNPDAPLRSTVFQLDQFDLSDWHNEHEVCVRDDAVWFVRGPADYRGYYLVKYNAGTGVRLLPSLLFKDGIVSCAVTSNSLWVLTGGGPFSSAHLTQIDIATNRVVKVVAPEGARVRVGMGIGALTTKNDTLWVLTEKPGNGKLYRIKENETHLVFLSKLREGEEYQDIVLAADSIWASDLSGCRVDRIDPASGKILAEISLTALGCRSPAYGEESVWLPSQDKDSAHGTIFRIDPDTNEVIAKIPVGPNPRSVVFAMGFAWVSTWGYEPDFSRRFPNGSEHHWLEKIDVHTNKVVDRYRLGSNRGQPLLVPVADALWAISDGVAWHIKVK